MTPLPWPGPLAAALIGSTLLSAGSTSTHAAPRIELVPGQSADGRPTAAWLHAIRHFRNRSTIERLAVEVAPYPRNQLAWQLLIEWRVDAWIAASDKPARLFDGIATPESLRVLNGNVGGNDAFTPDEATVAFDLRALHAVYGEASAPGNHNRIDRLYAHEYTHILHKPWRTVHDRSPASPLERACVCV